jgi:hypothetical protein
VRWAGSEGLENYVAYVRVGDEVLRHFERADVVGTRTFRYCGLGRGAQVAIPMVIIPPFDTKVARES